MPAGTYKTLDPKLVLDTNGEYHLTKGSPAINAAVGNYPGISVDMDAQPRIAPFDIGADEVSTAAVKARILYPADVGHAAGIRR